MGKRKSTKPLHLTDQQLKWAKYERARRSPTLTDEDRDYLDCCFLQATATILTPGVARRFNVYGTKGSTAATSTRNLIEKACQTHIKELQQHRRIYPHEAVRSLFKFLTRDVIEVQFMNWSLVSDTDGFELLKSANWVTKLVATISDNLTYPTAPPGLQRPIEMVTIEDANNDNNNKENVSPQPQPMEAHDQLPVPLERQDAMLPDVGAIDDLLAFLESHDC